MKLVVGLAVAGAAGTLARFALGAAVQRLAGGPFPWGTLCVNLLGCLLFGLVVGLWEARATLDSELKLILLAGFMGAFTTFSTLAFDSAGMMRDQQLSLALLNLLLHNGLGIVAIYAGIRAASVIS
jgi:CrcB protein